MLRSQPPAAPPVLGLARWRALHRRRLACPDGTPGTDGPVDGGHPPGDPLPAEVAWLVPALRDARLRDAILVSLLPGAPGSALHRDGDDPAADLAAGRVEAMPDLREFTDRPPDRSAFAAARALLARSPRRAGGYRAEALALLAMAWWQGSGRARLLAALALQDQPGHRLAAIVDELLLPGGPAAGWIRGAPERADRGDRGSGCATCSRS